MSEPLSMCCDDTASFETKELEGSQWGICSGCCEYSEFYFEEGCYRCGGDLKKSKYADTWVCEDCGEHDQ